MVFFKKKKEKIVDWRNKSFSPQQRIPRKTPGIGLNDSKNESKYEDGYADLSFFGSVANSVSQENNQIGTNSSQSYNSMQESSLNPEEKRSKLAKRLLDMTDKMEELSNQIYHLTQRIELIEKRLKINFE